MKFFADENVEGIIVNWLRGEGHDVAWSAESLDGEPDETVLQLALSEQRIVLTSDLDFGEHLFRNGLIAAGVIQMRIHVPSAAERLDVLQVHWPVIAPNALHNFIVVTKERVRRRRLP